MTLRGEIVFAESTWRAAVAQGLATALPLYLPPAETASTAGGLMGTGLRSLGIYGARPRPDDAPPWQGEEQVHVVFDSGSQGFFVIDDTGDAQDRSFLDSVPGLYSPGATHLLELGDLEGGPSFTVVSPPEWRRRSGGDDPAAFAPFRPERPPNKRRTQILLLGNMWLLGLSLTYSLSLLSLPGDRGARRPHLVLGHLDGRGNRSATYAGPRPSEAPPASAPPSRGAPDARKLPSGWGSHGWHGPALSLAEFSPAGSPLGQKVTDVAVPLVFLSFDQSGQPKPLTSADAPFEPALDVTLPRGVRLTPIVDTGSGVNILLPPTAPGGGSLAAALTLDPCVAAGTCQCQGAGRVRDVVSRVMPNVLKLDASRYPTRSDCRSDATAEDAFCARGCCATCCLASGVSADTVLPCSVAYCTGLLGYSPAETTVTLASERLAGMEKVFAGRGERVCEPLISSGILGFWYWMSPQVEGAIEQAHATTMPYHVLRHLGQLAGENNNFSIRIWRSDASPSGALPTATAPLVAPAKGAPPAPPPVSPPLLGASPEAASGCPSCPSCPAPASPPLTSYYPPGPGSGRPMDEDTVVRVTWRGLALLASAGAALLLLALVIAVSTR
jgi:hypothetical protein